MWTFDQIKYAAVSQLLNIAFPATEPKLLLLTISSSCYFDAQIISQGKW